MRRLDLWRYNDFIHVGSYFVAYRKRVIDDPRVPGPAGQRRRAERQDDDHPQVRDRLLPAADPRRPPPRDVRRRDPALPPGLPGVGLRPDARRLPAAQAAVPLREPLLPPGPAAVEGAGARRRARRGRRGHGAQPAPRRAGVEPAPQLRHPLAARRYGELPQGLGPDTFDDEDRWTPSTRTGGSSRSTPGPACCPGSRVVCSRPCVTTRRSTRSCCRAGGRSGRPARASRPSRERAARPDVRPALAAPVRHGRPPQRRQPPALRATPHVPRPGVPGRARATRGAAHRPVGRA